MKTHIIRIGNSRGLRLPKALLAQCRLGDAVEIEVEDNHFVIRSARTARAGWDQAFATVAGRGDDTLLVRDTRKTTDWDKTEWRW